jgi:hypothetical protein
MVSVHIERGTLEKPIFRKLGSANIRIYPEDVRGEERHYIGITDEEGSFSAPLEKYAPLLVASAGNSDFVARIFFELYVDFHDGTVPALEVVIKEAIEEYGHVVRTKTHEKVVKGISE